MGEYPIVDRFPVSRTRTQRKQPPIVLTAKIIATIRCALSLLVSGGMVLATGGYRSGVETAFGGLSLALAVLYGAFVVGLWLNANWGRLGALTVESLNLAVLVFFFFTWTVPANWHCPACSPSSSSRSWPPPTPRNGTKAGS